MKFVMIVLAIHFIREVISSKRKKADDTERDETNKKILHPAEFDLR